MDAHFDWHQPMASCLGPRFRSIPEAKPRGFGSCSFLGQEEWLRPTCGRFPAHAGQRGRFPLKQRVRNKPGNRTACPPKVQRQGKIQSSVFLWGTVSGVGHYAALSLSVEQRVTSSHMPAT